MSSSSSSAPDNSSRPRVTYTSGVSGNAQCGAKPPAPVIRQSAGDGGDAPDGGGEVAGAWVRASDDDPRASAIWEFRPAAPLAPMT